MTSAGCAAPGCASVANSSILLIDTRRPHVCISSSSCRSRDPASVAVSDVANGHLTKWVVTIHDALSTYVGAVADVMPGYLSRWPCGPYGPAGPWTKKPAMFDTVMHGLLVGHQRSSSCSWRDRAESDGGLNNATGISRGLIRAHPGAQLSSTRCASLVPVRRRDPAP